MNPVPPAELTHCQGQNLSNKNLHSWWLNESTSPLTTPDAGLATKDAEFKYTVIRPVRLGLHQEFGGLLAQQLWRDHAGN